MRLNGHREAAFTYQECVALMDEAGADRALILPPSWEGDRTDFALEACEAHPDRFGVMARIPQTKPAEGAIKSLPPADGTAEILVPGERGRRTRAERAATGIPLGPKVWREQTEVATALDVPVPAPLG